MFLLMVAMFMLALLQPNFAFAQPGNLDSSPISRGLCNVFELASGNIGKAIAIFAIVAVGFGFFTGKFSIALVIGITLGIGILFGAPKIISALTGTDAVDCQDVNAGDSVACPFYNNLSGASGLSFDSSNINRSMSFYGTQIGTLYCTQVNDGQFDIYFSPQPFLNDAIVNNIFTVSGLSNPSNAVTNATKFSNSPVRLATITSSSTNATFTHTSESSSAGLCRATPAGGITATWQATTSCGGDLGVAGAYHSSSRYAACISNADIFKSNIPIGASPSSTPANTHLATANPTGNFTLSIGIGYATQTRTFNIANGTPAKLLTATCNSGKWNITHTGSAVAPSQTNLNTNYNFQ